MLIDWFTVGAQALNFLILVWLMKRFLYKPILNAIDAREKRIAAELADAAAKKAEAQREHEEFQHKNEEFDQQRAALLSKATDEAKGERQRLLDEARKAADALSAKRQEALRNDAHNLGPAISRRTQQEVFAITRKALTDLATTSLEERLGEVFTRRLREMDGKSKDDLGQALKTASDAAIVRSAFDLPAEQRAAIQNALNETFSADIHLRFEIAPDLVSGIELTTNGQKVAWSIADYLASMEKSVGELLKEQDKPVPRSEPKAEVTTEQKPEAKAPPKPLSNEEAKAETEAEPKAESKPETKAEIKPASKAEPTTNAKVALTSGTKAKSEARAAPKSEAEVKATPQAKIEPKEEATAQAKSMSEVQVETGPEAGSAPEPEAEAKAVPVGS
jgi:F-type H+-transporting ATPase subunit b